VNLEGKAVSEKMSEQKLQLDAVVAGDVLKVLRNFPDSSVDLTITSPPYNKRNKSHGWLVTNKKYSHFDDHMPEEKYQAWQVEVLTELLRVTKPGGSVFYNHKLRWVDGVLIHPYSWLIKSKWNIKQEIIWDRAIVANMRGWRFWQIDERVYWLYKPVDGYLIGDELESRHAKFSSIWRMKPEARTELHPAPFPIELPVRVIYSVLNKPKRLVLDPFCGTGTALVAAKLLRHHYIGIDISPTYVEIARNRLTNAESERKRVEEEVAKHIIDDSFIARKKRGTITWPYGPKLTK
jgi:modification methylase